MLQSFARVVVTAVILISGVSCASVKTAPGTITESFFQNPDQVWLGIEETLETLSYEIESFNRTDGVIRTKAKEDGDLPAVVLEINQIVYTQDQVNVFVKPVAGDPSAAPTQEALDKAAQDFVTVLIRRLGS